MNKPPHCVGFFFCLRFLVYHRPMNKALFTYSKPLGVAGTVLEPELERMNGKIVQVSEERWSEEYSTHYYLIQDNEGNSGIAWPQELTAVDNI